MNPTSADKWSDDLMWALYCAIWDAEDEGQGRSEMTQEGLRKALEYHGLIICFDAVKRWVRVS